jgi:aspartyl-tRNA(Asn)/glutamyl-tRNA(Gln) amidotransferase subunit A
MSSALALGRRLAAGELDPAALAEEALARAHDAGCAFIAVTEARARREAAASAERLRARTPLGPLDGVPIAWKDLIDVAGVATTSASALRRGAPPATADAPIVARLAAAGLVCVGKTNLTEFAYSGLGLNPHFGTPRNPHGAGPARIPGGSSSGSAVAVATGVVPCAIGSDTSGSIRVPAAFCGVVGFKPTAARVDRDGVQPLAPTLDSVGPLTTTVADAVVLDALLRGAPPPHDVVAARRGAPPPHDVAAAPTACDAHEDRPPPRFVVPEGDLVDDVEPAVASAFAAALAALADAGAAIEHRPLAAVAASRALQDEHGILVMHEAWRVHRALLDSGDAERLDRRVLRRLRDGRALPPHGRDVLLRERPRLQAALAAELGDALALWPTVPHAAPELAPLERDDELFAHVNTRTLRNTIPASFLDMPGVALPMGTNEAGMPLGLLLSGPPRSDDRVLPAALAAEAALSAVARAR